MGRKHGVLGLMLGRAVGMDGGKNAFGAGAGLGRRSRGEASVTIGDFFRQWGGVDRYCISGSVEVADDTAALLAGRRAV